MLDIALVVLFVGGCAFLYWAANQIEPHWSSKDGRRLVARVQEVHPDGRTGRWREVRISVAGDGALLIRTRGLIRRVAGGGLDGAWTVEAKAPDPPRRRAVYLLDGDPQLALRLPANSRSVAVLDEILTEQR